MSSDARRAEEQREREIRRDRDSKAYVSEKNNQASGHYDGGGCFGVIFTLSIFLSLIVLVITSQLT